MAHVQAIEALMPQLSKQLAQAEKGGAITMARAFVAFHRMNDRIAKESAFKAFKETFSDYKDRRVPHVFEVENVPNVPLSEGFRVQISTPWRASMKPDQKEAAYEWLHKHYPDVIQPTVNASTLSALAKEMNEENKELPEAHFNAQQMPTTSVVKL